MATNIYLKFESPTIDSGSSSGKHAKEIEVLSWSHGFSQSTSPTRSAAGSSTVEQANHQNFSFAKYVDSATDDMLKKCWSGEQIGKATLTCYRADGTDDAVEYLKVLMEHVIVSSVSLSGGPGDIPVENISLDYGIVTYTYKGQGKSDGKGSGNQEAKHDLEKREVS